MYPQCRDFYCGKGDAKQQKFASNKYDLFPDPDPLSVEWVCHSHVRAFGKHSYASRDQNSSGPLPKQSHQKFACFY